MKILPVSLLLPAYFILLFHSISCKVNAPAEKHSGIAQDSGRQTAVADALSPGTLIVNGCLLFPDQDDGESFSRLRVEEVISSSSGLSNFISSGDTILLRKFKFSGNLERSGTDKHHCRLRFSLQEQLSIDPEGVVYSVKDIREPD